MECVFAFMCRAAGPEGKGSYLVGPFAARQRRPLSGFGRLGWIGGQRKLRLFFDLTCEPTLRLFM